jgi:hypothetical protein
VSALRINAVGAGAAQGGEIAFGALEAGFEVEYARDSIGFHWAGCEEGDEVHGEGTAELLDDGSIEIEFEYRNGGLLPPQAAEMSCYFAAEEITSICADSLVVRAVWPNRSAAGGAESRRFSRHTFS